MGLSRLFRLNSSLNCEIVFNLNSYHFLAGIDGNNAETAATKTVAKKKKRVKKAPQTLEDQIGTGLPEEFQDLQDDFIDVSDKPHDITDTERSNEHLVSTKPITSNRLFVERKGKKFLCYFHEI